MTLNKLASEIAKREGKRSEASIGNIREMLSVLTEIFAEDLEATTNGIEIKGIIGEEPEKTMFYSFLIASNNKAKKFRKQRKKAEEKALKKAAMETVKMIKKEGVK